MEKVNIYSLDGRKKESVEKPKVFSVDPRIDLIQKASEVSQSKSVQPQGRNKRAGLRNTASSWGTGHGMSRAPRIKGSGFPTARNVGRVPFAKGGRQTHPIKVEKNLVKKINKKTRKLSLFSAISATGNSFWIKKREYEVDQLPELPLVIDDKIQTVKKTSQIYSILCELGLQGELDKIKKSRKIRSGRGKSRGRKYKRKKGILIIIKEDFGILRASRNISGTEVLKFEDLSIKILAPGGVPGRLTLWTQSAFNELKNYEVIS